jgi:hypothetical protein
MGVFCERLDGLFLAESDLISFGTLPFGSVTATSTLPHFQHFSPTTSSQFTLNFAMSSLLHIACRVEAAVEAYISVKEYANWELWKAGFSKENVRKVFNWPFYWSHHHF